MLFFSRIVYLNIMITMINALSIEVSLGQKQNISAAVATLPTYVDWRRQGLVYPVKNQQNCNSGWAFAATGSLEGQHKKNKGRLVSLSEQNLIDCSNTEGNKGCAYGLADNAFKYVKRNGGIDTEKSYPYEGRDGSCRFRKGSVGATCFNYVDIPSGDEAGLTIAVATVGPIAARIDASHSSFESYTFGIYYEENCSSINLNHAVLVIGYGTEKGQDYWLAKNSYGTGWGEEGYIRMARNKDNHCGIATQASYPLV